MLFSVALVGVWAAIVSAGAQQPGRPEPRCAAYCLSDATSKFFHRVGFTYLYRYSSDVETKLEGTSEQASRLHITAIAEITANSACDFTLKLRDVTLSDSDSLDARRRTPVDQMGSFRDDLQRYPLSFSYQDGRVEELCSSTHELVWVLNFKRGLLSALVNNLETLERSEQKKYEMDISGYCATDYDVTATEGVKLVTKTKDLLTCRERGRLVTSLQTVPYHSGSNMQSMPLLRSTLQCSQTVRGRRITDVECHEQHLFRPFSRGDSGAVSRSTMRLQELEIRPAQILDDGLYDDDGALTARSIIIFDHADGVLRQHSRLDAVAPLLSQLEHSTSADVRPETPRLFGQLVQILRGADARQLQEILSTYQGRRRRLILDALPNLSTAGALASMRDLVVAGDKDLKPGEIDRWMTSLAFIHEPNADMVGAAKQLLAPNVVTTQTLLGVSTLVHNYVKTNPKRSEQEVVKSVITAIEKLLGSNCRIGRPEDKILVLGALKALGNAGVLVNGHNVLRGCFGSQSNAVDIRVEAIRAYRRMSCRTLKDSGLVSVFTDHRENVEVRIAAYLSAVQCPSHAVVDNLLELLTKETVNQVGSFVWTHLTNLRETNDPSKQFIKKLLHNVELAKKFNTDGRKFSRYFEKTLYFESMNAGMSSEGTVVFSPSSYVPRSAMLNITVDLFGEAINIFEVGARVQGLEGYIEKLFDGNGIYPQETVANMLKTLRGAAENSALQKLSDSFNKANSGAEFQGSTYLKIFGNELSFATFDDIDALTKSFSFQSPQKLGELLKTGVDWTDNYQFLDTSYTIPTILGLPFIMKATGTAAVSLKTGGNIDIRGWNRVQATGFVKPSAAVQIVSEMGVDAYVARTGLKMTSSFHSSTVLDGDIHIDSGRIVSLKVNMPKDKVELLDVKTEFHHTGGNDEKQLDEPRSGMFEFSACSEAYSGTVLGLNFCASVKYPYGSGSAPIFPLSGPLSASFSVSKSDTITAFVFEYSNLDSVDVRSSKVMIDTPGSSINRRIQLDYTLNIPRREFLFGLVTPLKSLELYGGLNLDSSPQTLQGHAKLDGQEMFGVSAQLRTEESSVRARYHPSLLLRGPRGPLLNLVGDIEANLSDRTQPKYTIGFTLAEPFETPVEVRGTVERSHDGTYALSSTVQSHALRGSISATFLCTITDPEHNHNGMLLLKLSAQYRVLEAPRQTISLVTKLNRQPVDQSSSDESLRVAGESYRGYIETKVSGWPVLDTQLSAELKHWFRLGYSLFAEVKRGARAYVLRSELMNRRGKTSAEVTFEAAHFDIDLKLALNVDSGTALSTVLSGLARLNRQRYIAADVVVHHAADEYRYHYGVVTNVTMATSHYLLHAAVQRDITASHLTFVALRSAAEGSREIRLLGTLAEQPDGATSVKASLSLPDYPSTRLGARLSGGAGGVFGVTGELQRGAATYRGSLQYKYSGEHIVEALAAGPVNAYSAMLAAKTDAGSYKFRADLNVGRRIMTVISLRPSGEQLQANFELFWNKDVDDTQKVILKVAREGYQITANLQYPGRNIRMVAGLTERGVRAQLDYAPNRRIIAEGSLVVQPGEPISVKLAVKTPFPGYTSIEVTFRNVPAAGKLRPNFGFEVLARIEDRVAVLTCQLEWLLLGSNTEAGNYGSVALSLRTPVSGWELLNVTMFYQHHLQGLQGRLEAAKNDVNAAFGVVLNKKMIRGAYKVKAGVDFELPVEIARSGRAGVDLGLRDSKISLDSLVQWTNRKVNMLSISLGSSYNFKSAVAIDSKLVMKSSLESIEDILISVLLKQKDRLLRASLIAENLKQKVAIFHAQLNTELRSSTSFEGDFKLSCHNCPGFGASIDYVKEDRTSNINVTAEWKQKQTIFTLYSAYPSEEKRDLVMTLVLPNPERQYQLKHSRNINHKANRIQASLEVSRDQQKVTGDVNLRYSLFRNGTFLLLGDGSIISPFLGWETASLTENAALHRNEKGFTFENTVVITRMNQEIRIYDSGNYSSITNWQVHRDMVSNSAWFRKVSADLMADWQSRTGQFTGKAAWDDQTAHISFKNAANDDPASIIDMSLAFQWFGQEARKGKLLLTRKSNAWEPYFTFTYAPEKTVKLYGSIKNPDYLASSQLTLETPFMERIILKESHDIVSYKKHALLELRQGTEKTYAIGGMYGASFPTQLDVSTTLSVPLFMIGKNIFNLSYTLSDTLHLSGRLAHDRWAFSFSGEFDRHRGNLTIETPLRGLGNIIFTYRLQPKQLLIHLRSGRGNIGAVIRDQSNYDLLEYTLEFTSPYEDLRSLTVTVTKPTIQNMFNIRAVHNSRNVITLSGQYELSAPRSSIDVQLATPFHQLRTSQLQVSYDLVNYAARFMFSKGSQKLEADAAANIGQDIVTMAIVFQNSLFRGPRKFTVTGTFNVAGSEKTLDVQLIKDSTSINVKGRAQLADVDSYVILNVVSPIAGYESIAVACKLTNEARGPTVNFELAKNQDVAKANLKFDNTPTSGRVQFDMQTPFEMNYDIFLSAEYDMLSNPIHAEVVAERDGVRKVVLATADWSATGAHLTLSTPFQGIESIDIQTSLRRSSDIIKEVRLMFKCNDERVDLMARGEISWWVSEITVEANVPFDLVRNMLVIAKYDFTRRTNILFVSVIRDGEILEISATGNFDTVYSEGSMHIITPFADWQELKLEASYDLSFREKLMELKYEKNGIKQLLSARGSYDGESVGFTLSTPFEGFEDMGAKTFYSNELRKREVGFEAHINDQRHRFYVLYENQGMHMLKVRLNTPVHGMRLVEVDARTQSLMDGIGVFVDSNVEGRRNSIQIRSTIGHNVMGFDIDVRSHREGFEHVRVSGNLDYSGKKKAFSLKSDMGKRKIELSGYFAVNDNGGTGKFVAKLPFASLKRVNLKLKYKLGDVNSFTLQYQINGQKEEISGDLQYTQTSFIINFQTPFSNFESVTAKASRSKSEDGSVTAELNLIRNTRHVSIRYSYLFSATTGNGSIEISTPYEGFEDMKMMLNYDNELNHRGIEFKARRNSREWHIKTSRKWDEGTEEDHLELTSPIETIRSLKISRSFDTRDLAAMHYYASYERNDRKFTISGTGSLQAKGRKVSLDLVVQTPLEIGQLSANVGYDFTRTPLTFNTGLAAGERSVNVEARVSSTAGSAIVTTTLPSARRMDMTYAADIRESSHSVTASVVLADGRRFYVKYRSARTGSSSVSASVELKSTQYGEGSLTWLLSQSNDDLTARIELSSSSLNGSVSIDVQGDMFIQRRIVASTSISTKSFKKDYALELNYNTHKGLHVACELGVDNQKHTVSIEANEEDHRKSARIEYNGHMIKDIEFYVIVSTENDGLGLFIEYTREKALQGVFNGTVSISDSGKSGSIGVNLVTPFVYALDVQLDTTWQIQSGGLLNSIVTFLFRRSENTYSANLRSAGLPLTGVYSIDIVMPNLGTTSKLNVSEFGLELKYDFVNRYFVEAILKNPLQLQTKLEYSMAPTQAFTMLADWNDSGFISESVVDGNFELSLSQRQTADGLKVDVMLDTTLTQLNRSELSMDLMIAHGKSSVVAVFKRGGETIRIEGELSHTPDTGTSLFSLKAPIIGMEDAHVFGSFKHLPGKTYRINIDFGRKHKFFRLEAMADVSKNQAASQSLNLKTLFTVVTNIVRKTELSVTTDTSLTDLGSTKQSGSGKFTAELNGRKAAITYNVDRDDHGRRKASMVMDLPLEEPYRKIVVTSDVSLHSQKLSGALEYGSNLISGELSWLVGEAGQYGTEVRINTPYEALKILELDITGILNRDQSVDVAAYLRHNNRLSHMTGLLRPYAIELSFETPVVGQFLVRAGGELSLQEQRRGSAYALVTLPSGVSVGGELTVKAASLSELQLTVDVQTPLARWRRLTLDAAWTATAQSRLLRAMLQLPGWQRLGVSLELTNRGGADRTDLRAGITGDYLGSVFTFATNIYRNSASTNTRPDSLELQLAFGSHSFSGRLSSSPQWPMDFLTVLDGRRAEVRVFQPSWHTLRFLVSAGPFQYRGNYLIGGRHLSAQMATVGSGPPQHVEVNIDLESLGTIAMKVTTLGEDGKHRDMTFSYHSQLDKFLLELELNMPTRRHGVRLWMRETAGDWSAASANVMLFVDEPNFFSVAYQISESSVSLLASADGALVPVTVVELTKTGSSIKTVLQYNEQAHLIYGRMSILEHSQYRIGVGLQVPVLSLPPISLNAGFLQGIDQETLFAAGQYGDLDHFVQAHRYLQGSDVTFDVSLDTPLYGLRDVQLDLKIDGNDTAKAVTGTLWAFKETNVLDVTTSLAMPYKVHMDLISRRLPAGSLKLLGELDVKNLTSILAHARVNSGRHKSAAFFLLDFDEYHQANNAIMLSSTIWSINVDIQTQMDFQNGFSANSSLISSSDILPYGNLKFSLLPTERTDTYQVTGYLDTPVQIMEHVRIDGLLPNGLVSFVRQNTFITVHGPDNMFTLALNSDQSSTRSKLVQCSLTLPNVPEPVHLKLLWGDKWDLQVSSDIIFGKFLPRILRLSTDKINQISGAVDFMHIQGEMNGRVSNQPELREVQFNVITPVEGYRKMGIVGRLQNGKRKGVQAEITYLGQTFGTNLDFLLDGFDIVTRASLRTPFAALSAVQLDVTNLLDIAARSYEGRALARFGTQEASGEIYAKFTSISAAALEASGKLGESFITSALLSSEEGNTLQIAYKLESSKPNLQILKVTGFGNRASDSIYGGVQCELNSKMMVRIAVSGPVDNFKVEVENPFQPLHLEGYYKEQQETSAGITLILEPSSPTSRRIGANITYELESEDAELRIGTEFFDTTLGLTGIFGRDPTRFHNALLLQMNRGSPVGYDVSYRDLSRITHSLYYVDCTLKIPNRDIGVYAQHLQKIGKTKSDINLEWDSGRSPDKKVGMSVETNSLWEDWQSRRYNVSVAINHAALDHDIILDNAVQLYPVARWMRIMSVLRYTKSTDYNLELDASVFNKSTAAVAHYDVDVSAQQVVSGLDARLMSAGIYSSDYIDQNVSFSYQNKLTTSETFSISAMFDRAQRLIHGRLVTQKHDAWLRGVHQVQPGGVHVMQVTTDLDGVQRPMEMRVQTPTSTKPLDINVDITYERDRKLFLYMGMPTNRLISVSASRSLYGMQVEDASLNVRLNSSQLLSAVLRWRWQIAIDVKRRAVARFTSLLADAHSWLTDMTEFIKDEAARKERFIQPVLNEKWSAVSAYSLQEYAAVVQDLRGARDAAVALYQQDHFFIRTIYNAISSYLQRGRSVLDITTAGTRRAFQMFRDVLVDITSDLARSYQLLKRALRLLSSAVQGYIEEEAGAIRKLVHDVSSSAESVIADVQSLVDEAWSAVTSLFSEAWSRVRRLGSSLASGAGSALAPVLHALRSALAWTVRQVTTTVRFLASCVEEAGRELKEFMYELASAFTTQLLEMFYLSGAVEAKMPEWVQKVPGFEALTTMAATTKDVVISAYRGTLSFLQYNRAFLLEAYRETSLFVSQVTDDIPPVRLLFEWAQRVYGRTSWAWQYWEEGNQLRKAAGWLMQLLIPPQNATDPGQGLQLTDNKYVKFFPSLGYIEGNLPLPLEWDNFHVPPRISQDQTVGINDLAFDFTYFYYELLDFLNYIAPLYDVDLWLPPFDTYAFIAGSQHYITFDKRFYEYAGGCDYLLAADLKNLTFAVVVQYDQSRGSTLRKSLLTYHGEHILRLADGRELYLDERRVELPFRLESTIISRNGSRTILDMGNIRVECNIAFDVCSFRLMGRFHGRTGGLLGSFTNEAADDFTSPSGELLTRTDSFARTWELNNQHRFCRVKNLAIKAPGDDPVAEATCRSLFASEASALRPCYGVVDTAPFLRMCLNDLEANYNSPGRFLTACTSAAAYVAACAASDVDIWVPPNCVRCELEDGHVLHAAQTKLYLNNAPRFADVVIVVERKACQRRRSFRRILKAIDDMLVRRGITNNRFSVIGYGGEDVYWNPHINTLKGSIWGTSRAAGRALDTLRKKIPRKYPSEHKDAEVFAAIREACLLPFRGGVSKQVIMFSCSECPYRETEFPFTLKVLNLMDVKLHLVAATDFEMQKTVRRHSSKIVALGSELAYSTKDLLRAGRPGDRRLQPYVRLPKDLCSPLAIETNGTVFDSRQWSKNLRDLMADVVSSVATPSTCQECDCFADRDGVGKLECRTCISRALKGLLYDFEPEFDVETREEWFDEYDDLFQQS